MWGYYASNQGLCIEYDRDKLVKRLVIGFVDSLDYFTVNHLFVKNCYGIEPTVRTPDITQEEVDSAVENNDIIKNLISEKEIIKKIYVKGKIYSNIILIKSLFIFKFKGINIIY